MKKISRLFKIFLVLLPSACTTAGVHDRESHSTFDFGPREEVRICVLADEGIDESAAKLLLDKVREELSTLGLDVTVPWVRPWVRPAFSGQGIMEDLALRPLEPPCDRLLALVGRNAGDFFFGLLGAEILGGVETVSHTRGYVVAKAVSFNQLFISPTHAVIHESYHLLGCKHEHSLADCYPLIRELKSVARHERNRGNDFFSGVSWNDKFITSRQEANKFVRQAIEREKEESSKDSYEP